MCPETPLTYKLLEERIATWASTCPELLAGVIVGSRGRFELLADEWSDLDLIFFTTALDVFIQNGAWLEGFGELWASYLSYTGSGYPEWFAIYAGGLKLDIAFAPALSTEESSLNQLLGGFAHQDVIQRGVRILFDKTGGVELHQPITQPTPFTPPTPLQFRSAISQFWITSARALKLIQRGDLWRAKQACDGDLKSCLLTMLEWHTRTVYDPQLDTWYEGRDLSGWIDPRVLETLPGTFADYTQSNLQRALHSTLEMYTWLASETATQLGYPFPTPQDEAIVNWIKAA